MNADTSAKIVTMITENPAVRHYARAAMKSAIERKSYSSVIKDMSEIVVPKTCVFSPETVMDWLIEYEAIKLYNVVNGQDQEGSLEDLQSNKDLALSSQVSYDLETTPEGIDALDKLDPYKLTINLFNENYDVADSLLKVLYKIQADGGMSGQDIWNFLDGDNDALRYSKINGYPTIYPAFYTGALEDVDAIVWKNSGWYITEEGSAYLDRISGYVGPVPHTVPGDSATSQAS